jgi:Domain of unknown function (DUF4861)
LKFRSGANFLFLLETEQLFAYKSAPTSATMTNLKITLTFTLAFSLPALGLAAEKFSVTVVNQLPLARASQTIELSAPQLAPLDEKELNKLHVFDAAGKEVLSQAVDTDGDDYRTPDILIFQSDFAPGETKTFTVSAGPRHAYQKEDFKAYGRFVRERFDDFAWENDRIAHRTYGRALETWKGEPLTSSAIDIWAKRVARPVVNEWYMSDNYHHDSGEGCDDYSAGASRGDGGDGLWADNQLWVSRNFVNSRTLAAGPIRVLFELDYEPFEVNGIRVSEVKRVSLDAGQNLDHYRSFYTPFTRPEKPVTLTTAMGLKKVAGEQLELNATNGWLVSWQKMEKQPGSEGVAIVFDPKQFVQPAGDKLNNLVVARVSDKNVADYWAGFGWDQTGQFSDAAAWKKYVDEFAQGLRSPIKVSVSKEK